MATNAREESASSVVVSSAVRGMTTIPVIGRVDGCPGEGKVPHGSDLGGGDMGSGAYKA